MFWDLSTLRAAPREKLNEVGDVCPICQSLTTLPHPLLPREDGPSGYFTY